ncbi:MAG: hypothetical protein ACOYB3_05510 [Azonexus sp.]|jgi:hypothetical protein
MNERRYRAGDRVRLLAPMTDGWIGTATVTADQSLADPIVDFKKDNPEPTLGTRRTGFAYWFKLELIEAGPESESAP